MIPSQQMMPVYYVSVVVLIVFSAFFSSTEMAYSSANYLRIEKAGESGNKAAIIARRLMANYDDMLSTVLIGNNLVNIAATSMVSIIAIYIASKIDGLSESLAATLGTIIITLLLIIFGETVPKIIGKKNANRVAVRNSRLLIVFMYIFKPITFLVVGLVKLITKPMRGEAQASNEEAATEELASIIDTVEDEGVIDNERVEMLQAALEFSDISASEIMTARVDMLAIDIEDDWDEIMSAILSSPYSRLPVYQGKIDNIIGVLYLNHFFRAIFGAEEINLRPLLLKPCFVYKTVKLPAVLSEMRENRTHIAIVTDEYGGAMGLVTMEDVLEELVGDIWDETDEIELEVIAHSDNLYELDGDMGINDFLELLDISEDGFDTDSATVGGWTIENFGYFPRQGESFVFNNFRVMVLETDGKRIDRVLLRINFVEEENL